MKVHYIQHVPFEGVAAIGEWVAERGHDLDGTELFRSQAPREEAPVFPDPGAFDLLVVLGGPMGVHDDADYPWLPVERAFIRTAIAERKRVLGICLGAQLIAAALGADVKRVPHKEIGWYPVELTPAGRQLALFADFPARFQAFHWHSDMFEIPEGAVWAASSAACPYQALVLGGGQVVGLQFHLEETAESVATLVKHAGHELVGAQTAPRAETRAALSEAPAASSGHALPAAPGLFWVATHEEVRSPTAPYRACRELLFSLLDRMLLTS